MEANAGTPDDSAGLLARARTEDGYALHEIFSRHRPRLKRMVRMRLDRRLQGRIDDSDVVQEAFTEMAGRLEDYFREPELPVFLWMRLVVGERILRVHREHLGAQMRDAGREVPLFRTAGPAASSAALAEQLLGRQSTPSQAAVRAERADRLRDAINQLNELDREIVSLRHLEELGRAEAAAVLGITEEAAGKRYIRALKKLKDQLADVLGERG